MKKQDVASREAPALTRKTYSAPRLAYYGNVTHLTRAKGGNGNDGTGVAMTKQCWIAEVLYGIDAPRTRLVRAWLTESYERSDPMARFVIPLYSRFGVAVAGLLYRRPVLQRVFRPLFDRAVKCAHRNYAGRAVLLQVSVGAH